MLIELLSKINRNSYEIGPYLLVDHLATADEETESTNQIEELPEKLQSGKLSQSLLLIQV
jgi:hypothetical protein